MNYPFERVVELLWGGLRTPASAAKLIEVEWQAVSSELSLEQAIEEAFSRHANLGYGTEVSRERARETFGIELRAMIQPIGAARDEDDGSTADEAAR